MFFVRRFQREHVFSVSIWSGKMAMATPPPGVRNNRLATNKFTEIHHNIAKTKAAFELVAVAKRQKLPESPTLQ